MNPRRQAHCALAALMVVGALTACASGNQIGSISPQPMDQTAMVGEQVLFQCQYTEKELVPIWRINTVEYIPSTLPPGHWINSSGLVVSVREEMNGNTYQCQFKVFLSDSNGFFTPSSKQASLTVPSSTGNNIAKEEYLEGPFVTGYKYNSTSNSLTVAWDKLFDRGNNSLQISITNCSGLNQSEPATFEQSCNETELVGLVANGTILVEIQACNERGECGFNLPLVSPPNLIAINFTNEDTSTTDPVLIQPGQSYDLVNSCQDDPVIRSISSTGVRMDSVISSTSYLTSSTVGGKIQLQLANNYVQLIQQKLGDATKWLVVQEMCTAIVCDGRETAEIFGFRGVISVNDNSGIEVDSVLVAPNCTYHIGGLPITTTNEMTTSMLTTSTIPSSSMRVNPTTSLSLDIMSSTPSAQPPTEVTQSFDQVVAVSTVGATLVIFSILLAVVLIVMGILMKRRIAARTYGISEPGDKDDESISQAYSGTPEKSTVTSVPSYTTDTGVRTISAVLSDDDELDTPWGIIRLPSIGSGDYV